MFPYTENLQVSPSLQVHYKKIIEKIGPMLTDERRRRIQDVVQNRNFSTCVVLENIYDRGNASAVMRTAEAFGFQLFEVIELSEKFKESARVTAGADKWLHARKWKNTKDCVLKLKEEGFQICATSLEASLPINEIDFSKKVALVLGNEKDGVSREMLDLADHRIVIPMQGFVQSFNISVAGALSLYHAQQDRIQRLGTNSTVTEEQKEILKALYYLKTLDSAPEILSQI